MKLALLIAAMLSLQGCFFVFIPGSLINRASDSMTGAEGSHCVSTSAKIGDTIHLQGGGAGTVKSLSGTSSRCTTQEYPIRALLTLQ